MYMYAYVYCVMVQGYEGWNLEGREETRERFGRQND